MSREVLVAYFEAIEQPLLTLPSVYVEQFSATILSPERANLKLRVRVKAKYLLAVSRFGALLRECTLQPMAPGGGKAFLYETVSEPIQPPTRRNRI